MVPTPTPLRQGGCAYRLRAVTRTPRRPCRRVFATVLAEVFVEARRGRLLARPRERTRARTESRSGSRSGGERARRASAQSVRACGRSRAGARMQRRVLGCIAGGGAHESVPLSLSPPLARNSLARLFHHRPSSRPTVCAEGSQHRNQRCRHALASTRAGTCRRANTCPYACVYACVHAYTHRCKNADAHMPARVRMLGSIHRAHMQADSIRVALESIPLLCPTSQPMRDALRIGAGCLGTGRVHSSCRGLATASATIEGEGCRPLRLRASWRALRVGESGHRRSSAGPPHPHAADDREWTMRGRDTPAIHSHMPSVDVEADRGLRRKRFAT